MDMLDSLISDAVTARRVAAIRDRRWQTIRIPELSSPPPMLIPDERKLLYYLTRTTFGETGRSLMLAASWAVRQLPSPQTWRYFIAVDHWSRER